VREWLCCLVSVAVTASLGCDRGAGSQVTPAQLEARAGHVASYRAQVASHFKVAGQELNLTGTIQGQPPDQLRVEMYGPDGTLMRAMVRRGEVLMQHDPAQQRVTKVDLARVAEATGKRPPAAQGTDLSRPFEGLDLAATTYVEAVELDGAKAHLFEGPLKEAAALAPRLGFEPDKARVWVDDRTGLLRRTEILSKAGDSGLTQEFTAIEVDPALSSEVFYLKPPEGVSVTDLTEAMIQALSAQ
jgi:outer membrane lipoprotein-sorting protein